MKDIFAMHESVRKKWKEEWVLDIPTMMEMQKEKKIEDQYAEKLGLKIPLGLERGGHGNFSETLLGFFIGREVIFFAEEAHRAKKIIEDYAERLRSGNMEGLEGSDRMVLARIASNRLRIDKYEGVDRLVLWGSHWNDWLLAIYKMGYGFIPFSIEEAS